MFLVTLHDVAAHSTKINERHLVVVAVIDNVCRLQIAMLLSSVAAMESSDARAHLLEESHELIEVALLPELVNDEREQLAMCAGHHHNVTKVASSVVLHPNNLCRECDELIRNDVRMLRIDLEQVVRFRKHRGMARSALHNFEHHLLTQ